MREECVAVLDTKYKVAESPTADDVAQIVAYAVAMGAKVGVLVYPRRLAQSFRAEVGGISIRAVGFAIDEDLEGAGQGFLAELDGVLAGPSRPSPG